MMSESVQVGDILYPDNYSGISTIKGLLKIVGVISTGIYYMTNAIFNPIIAIDIYCISFLPVHKNCIKI